MKAFVIFLIILTAIGVWSFIYLNRPDYILYKEAQELYAKGEIYKAHDKISEALEINPKNRKVISFKRQLFFIVENDSALKKAYMNKEEALKAIDRGDYIYAAEKFDESLKLLGDVSTLYERYDNAIKLQKEIMKSVNRLIEEAPDKYYLKGFDLYKKGEYERAYNMLENISSPTQKIVKLMDEIAYKAGCDKFDEVLNGQSSNKNFSVKESILWFEKVTAASPYYIDSKAKISKLKEFIEN